MILALAVTEWTAVGGILLSAAGVVVSIWKYATHLNNKREIDADKRQGSLNDQNERLRVELYEQNKILRAENQEQYDKARKLAAERDEMESELRRQYRYIDVLLEELQRLMLPAVFAKLPAPPDRTLTAD